jgi:hypothetical protein
MGIGRQLVLLRLPASFAAAGESGALAARRPARRSGAAHARARQHGDPAPSRSLLGARRRSPRFITDPRAERTLAKLGWLLPVLRWSIVAVWIATAIVSFGLYPVEDSYACWRAPAFRRAAAADAVRRGELRPAARPGHRVPAAAALAVAAHNWR